MDAKAVEIAKQAILWDEESQARVAMHEEAEGRMFTEEEVARYRKLRNFIPSPKVLHETTVTLARAVLEADKERRVLERALRNCSNALLHYASLPYACDELFVDKPKEWIADAREEIVAEDKIHAEIESEEKNAE